LFCARGIIQIHRWHGRIMAHRLHSGNAISRRRTRRTTTSRPASRAALRESVFNPAQTTGERRLVAYCTW
jgi:hypothetical protein